MADVKISALPAATVPLAGTEVLPIVQSATTRQVSVANLTAGRAISASSITNSALTSGRVTYAGASGLLSDSANLTWDNTNARLGIGTSSPATKLNIENAGECQLQMAYSSTIFGRVGRLSSGNYEFSSYENGGSLLFGTTTSNGSTTERMRIDSSGNVGIGTSSPSATLHVAGNILASSETISSQLTLGGIVASGVATGITLRTGSTKTAFLVGAQFNVNNAFEITPSTTAGGTTFTTPAFLVTSTGNVGIGTSSPVSKLDVTGQVTATGGIFKANGAPSLSAATAGEAILAPESSLGALLYGRGTTYDVVIGNRGTNVALAVTANTINLVAPGNLAVTGSVSKGSGSFRIEHPLPQLAETHYLVHSFIEGPQADLIYRGKVNLVGGTASVNIDSTSTMTEGTFVALCRDVQCFTTNESDWTAVRGSVTGNILTIEAQDNTSTASISWMVIGERKDKHMYDTDWTDDDGKVIVEPLKSE